MGLDWNPLGRPKPGFESEFQEIFDALTRKFDKTKEAALLKRWHEIETSPHETLSARRVGFDATADRWADQMFDRRTDRSVSLSQFKERMRGYYVLQLVPPCDGLPRYSNGPAGYVELFSFRAQFLRACEGWLGEELLDEAYENHLAPALVRFGEKLWECAVAFAKRSEVSDVFNQQEQGHLEGAASQAHIAISASRWATFWGTRGHGM